MTRNAIKLSLLMALALSDNAMAARGLRKSALQAPRALDEEDPSPASVSADEESEDGVGSKKTRSGDVIRPTIRECEVGKSTIF